jgi:DNA polymerase phi
MVDVLSTMDSWLYKVAQHFLKELSDWVGNDDVRRVAVIVALQRHSNARFDGITKTKTVKALVTEFKTESGCMLFIQNLMNMFVDEGNASEEPSDQSQTTDDNSEMGSVEDKDSNGATANSDFLKTWVVESLPIILKHLKLEPEARFGVQKEILKFLAVQGLFSASLGSEVTSFELQEKFKWPKAPTSSAICRMCIEQIQSLLANAQKIEGLRSLSSGLEHSDLGSYFMRFLSTLRNIPSVSLFRSLSDDDEKAFEKLQEMETRLSREVSFVFLLSATLIILTFEYGHQIGSDFRVGMHAESSNNRDDACLDYTLKLNDWREPLDMNQIVFTCNFFSTGFALRRTVPY